MFVNKYQIKNTEHFFNLIIFSQNINTLSAHLCN